MRAGIAQSAGLTALNPACPAFLDTLKVSVPSAVKLAAATANLDDLESPAVASVTGR